MKINIRILTCKVKDNDSLVNSDCILNFFFVLYFIVILLWVVSNSNLYYLSIGSGYGFRVVFWKKISFVGYWVNI